jgi:TonB family protein
VAIPAGNRRGTFSANPQGKPGASGTPELTGSKSDAKGSGRRGDDKSGNSARNGSFSLPAGLHVGAADSGADEGREVASLSPSRAGTGARAVSAVSEDKITDVDRQVFGGKRPYAMTLNMPNLNSSTGSWEIRFAEVEAGKKIGDLLAPVAMEKSDPGYPLELIRSNVHGMVTLYAVIGADGKVAKVRVLNSPDDRLDAYAEKALYHCKFAPAERAGKPVALEAVVRIPFRVRRTF